MKKNHKHESKLTTKIVGFFIDKNIDVSSIHLLLLKQKYEIFAVDCTQIKDLNNLCVRPTIACKQAKLGLDWLRYTPLKMTFKEIASISSLTLKVNKLQNRFIKLIENKKILKEKFFYLF